MNLRMPSEDELPPGATRAFVEELFTYFKEGERPRLQDVANQTQVSRETVRRLLRGQTFSRWETINRVFEDFCKRAGINPDERRYPQWGEASPSRRQYLKNLWNKAVDEPLPDAIPEEDSALPPDW
ncbi:hypothetical protein [Streptomyces hydrogenans]